MNVDDQRNQTQDQLTDITNRLDALERKLDLILTKLDGSVIKNCDKMGNHIDFVNGVYATVKVPLNYISNKMHKIINPLGSHKELPLLREVASDDDR
jgi:hypothetical protein